MTMSAAANTEMGEDERLWKQLLEVSPLDDPPRPAMAAEEARAKLERDKEFLGWVNKAIAAAKPGKAATSDPPTRDAPTDVEDGEIDRLWEELLEECQLSGCPPRQPTAAEGA